MYRTAFMLAILLSFPGFDALACSCSEFLNEAPEALERSSLVFVGRPVSRETMKLPLVMNVIVSEADGGSQVVQSIVEKTLVTFQVSRVWKGAANDSYVVMTGGSWCEPRFPDGREYLVFTAGRYAEANECAPTGEIDGRQDVIEALNQLVAPIEPSASRHKVTRPN